MSYTANEALRARRDFPALNRQGAGPTLAYLDGPGGSQVPQCVIDAIADVYSTCNVNTHGNFPPSQEVDRRMEAARRAVATFLGAPDASCISFGQNMTTLNFALANALVKTWNEGDEVLITQLDHEGNRGPWLNLRERGVQVKEVRMLDSGVLDGEDMAAKITPRTRLLAIGASSNALGTVNDIALARRLTREVGALLVLDAVHYAPHFPIDVQVMGVDFLLCSAYKFYGPHVGILYSRPGALAELPTDRLSTQEPVAPYRIETGTLNHAAIAGVHAAISYIAGFGRGAVLRDCVVDAMTCIARYEHSLAEHYYSQVRALPGVRVWGPDFSRAARAPTVSITLARHTPDAAATALGRQGICVWNGNFYAARAVEILGLEAGGGLLRTGISMYTTQAEVDHLLSAVAALG
jgi:cysteine desulfurase family protein (TIGR01976 family)